MPRTKTKPDELTTIGYVDDHGYVTYAQITEAMVGQPFPMEAMGAEGEAIVWAVNQGIDARLQACNCPERGDSYEPHHRRIPDGRVIASGIKCSVSPESMPVLLRRLMELPSLVGQGRYKDLTDEVAEEGESLAMSLVDMILTPCCDWCDGPTKPGKTHCSAKCRELEAQSRARET